MSRHHTTPDSQSPNRLAERQRAGKLPRQVWPTVVRKKPRRRPFGGGRGENVYLFVQAKEVLVFFCFPVSGEL